MARPPRPASAPPHPGLVIAVLVLLGAAYPATGSPLPVARPAAPAGVTPAGGPWLAPGPVPRIACGTRRGAVGDVLSAHVARPAITPLPTSHSTDEGDIAVLEDDGGFFFADKNEHVRLDLAAVSEAFYRTHGDDYDVLVVFLASGLSDYLGSPGAFAASFGVRNPTLGIGLDVFDFGAGFGSPSRLQTVLSMNGMDRYPADPDSNLLEGDLTSLDVLTHELGHRWLAYVGVDSGGLPTPALLGRDYQHWNFFFDSDASVMDGCDWVPVQADSFLTDSITTGYGRLDLYLMGLLSKGEIDSLLVVNDPHGFNPPGNYVPAYPPLDHLGCRGRATWWKMSDIEAANGPRVPDAATAPRAFRVGFILVTANGNAASTVDLAKLETLRARFPGTFSYATRGRGTLDCTLSSRAGHVRITHRPLPDTEDPNSARPVGCRVAIAQGGIPIALDTTSVAAHWRPTGSPTWTVIPFVPAGGDSFAGSLPALPPGGEAQYYLHAASDSSGIDAFDPPGGALAPHVYRAGPDLTPPVIVHAPPRDQGQARMPLSLLARVTDNLGVDSVWVEYAVDAGPTQTLGASRAGLDSFAVSLGAGLVQGRRLAYRLMARDRAAAHNLATSNPAADTVWIGRNWLDDFENGSAGYTHAPYWYMFRDEWHLTQEDSWPGGGTSWKCGAVGSGSYPPHLDSDLYPPVIEDLVPGTVLEFEHRYELEQADGSHAWDGAKIEGQVGGGPWQVLMPTAGYSHTFLSGSNPSQAGTPCWSGSSGGWRGERVDLSGLAPGPARVRFRLLADDFAGYAGWFVDHVQVEYPGTTGVPAAATTLAVGRPSPNPARAEIRMRLALPRAAAAEWSLYDIAGRRVATLWKGAVPAGAFEIQGGLGPVPAGLFFSRLVLDGREAARARIAVVK